MHVVAYSLLVEIDLAEGALADAAQHLRELEDLTRRHGFLSHQIFFGHTRGEYWLAAGNLAVAGEWADSLAYDPAAWEPNRQWEFLIMLRVHLARRQYARALAMAEEYGPLLDRPSDISTTVEFLALRAVALRGAGDHDQARAVALRMIELGAPGGYIRPLLNAGALLREVLQDLRAAEPARVRPFGAYLGRVLGLFGQDAAPPNDPPGPALPEPLTPREREVLRLLADGASNQQIAAALVISLATAKKHVSNLLGKLGAASRTQAIARARDLALID